MPGSFPIYRGGSSTQSQEANERLPSAAPPDSCDASDTRFPGRLPLTRRPWTVGLSKILPQSSPRPIESIRNSCPSISGHAASAQYITFDLYDLIRWKNRCWHSDLRGSDPSGLNAGKSLPIMTQKHPPSGLRAFAPGKLQVWSGVLWR